MKQRIFTFMMALMAVASGAWAQLLINEENFPDENFRNYLLAQDYGKTGKIGGALRDILMMDVSGQGITDLTGIQNFPNLWWLECSNNNLTQLDLSQNHQIVQVFIDGNNITGEAMDAFIASLPIPTEEDNYFNDRIYRKRTPDGRLNTVSPCLSAVDIRTGIEDGNSISVAQVAAAKAKGYETYCHVDGDDYNLYPGYDAFEGAIPINEENFPDEEFRTFISENYGSGGMLPLPVIQATKEMTTDSWNDIMNLKGIEYFTELEELRCYYCKISTLDLTPLTKLKRLYCDDIGLKSLIVPTSLELLYCPENKLTTLDLSACTQLKELNCSENKLTTLNIEGCTQMTTLKCYQNSNLATLNLTGLTQLEYLDCSDCKFATLNLTGFAKLTDFQCGGNLLTQLTLEGCTQLQKLHCEENLLTTLDLSTCTQLKELRCEENLLTSLKVANTATDMNLIHCRKNRLPETAMETFVQSLPTVEEGTLFVKDLGEDDEGNIMTPAQVETAKGKGWKVMARVHEWITYTEEEYAGSDPSKGVVINSENFPDENFRNYLLSTGYGSDGFINEEEQHYWRTLNAGDFFEEVGRGIHSLKGIEHIPGIQYLYACYNPITEIDLSKNTELLALDITDCQVTQLDFTHNTNLLALEMDGNQFTSLDVSMLPKLVKLFVDHSPLGTIDVSHNPNMENLSCAYCQLDNLDVSACTQLQTFNCHHNNIRGERMDALIESMPTVEYGEFYPIVLEDPTEGNVITTTQVAAVRAKGWKVFAYNSKTESWGNYNGSDPTSIIAPSVEENDVNAPIHNLAGQRVNASYKGIVIKRGKKILVR